MSEARDITTTTSVSDRTDADTGPASTTRNRPLPDVSVESAGVQTRQEETPNLTLMS